MKKKELIKNLEMMVEITEFWKQKYIECRDKKKNTKRDDGINAV